MWNVVRVRSLSYIGQSSSIFKKLGFNYPISYCFANILCVCRTNCVIAKINSKHSNFIPCLFTYIVISLSLETIKSIFTKHTYLSVKVFLKICHIDNLSKASKLCIKTTLVITSINVKNTNFKFQGPNEMVEMQSEDLVFCLFWGLGGGGEGVRFV